MDAQNTCDTLLNQGNFRRYDVVDREAEELLFEENNGWSNG
jgi:hypothetical protein